ncbi:MAG TPA: hypothetical protein VEC37_18645 [Bacillota bacterium]|nr:hypothetical protein [Bacillota bacterium]
MKRLILLCLGTLLLIGQVALAKEPPNATILIEPDWNKNRQMNYQYSIVTQKYNGDTLKNETISKGLIVNRRVRKDKKSFIFEMEYRDTESNDPVLNNPAYKAWMEEANKQKILYQVGVDGEFMGIQNLEAIQKLMEKMIDVLFGEQSDETVLQLKANMKQKMLSREFIENTITEEIKSLCDLYGLELEVNEPIAFETELPNILDGRPYPARFLVELTEYNQATGLCKGQIKVNPIPEKFTQITAETLQNLTGQKIDPKILKQLSLSITHSFEYDTKRKLITRLNYVKDTTDLTNRDRREVTLTLVE